MDSLSDGNAKTDLLSNSEMESISIQMEDENEPRNGNMGTEISDSIANIPCSQKGPDEAKIQSELRSKFLWSCVSLNGKKTKVTMFEGITVEGICRGMDKNITLMHMQDMKTPFTEYNYATLRLTDCLYASFKMEK